MTTWIALFRGINVGGHGELPMEELVALGFCVVHTYVHPERQRRLPE